MRDVYFGIHIGAGRDAIVQDNTIAPGMNARRAARPRDQRLEHGRHADSPATGSRDARDGIYLSFTNRVVVAGNVVTESRYGLHSMYSQDARFEDNDATGNLLGAALMMSDRLVLRRQPHPRASRGPGGLRPAAQGHRRPRRRGQRHPGQPRRHLRRGRPVEPGARGDLHAAT